MKQFYCFLFLVLLPSLVSATTPITGASQVGTTNSIKVTWGETDVNLTSPDVSLNRYQVSYNEVGQPAVLIDNISNSMREYTIMGLTAGRTYEVKVIEVIRVNLPMNPFIPFLDNFNSSAVRTVSLNSSPIARCRNITKSAGSTGTATITAAEIDNGSSDPENGVLIYALSTTGPFSVGVHSVTLTVTDVGGLTNSCTATVTVIDDTAPDVFTKEPVLELDPYGNATLTLDQIVIGFSDNAGTISNVELSKTQFGCSDLGEQLVQVSVTDNAGNVARKMVKVTVRDFIKPFIRHENQYFTLAANGYATLTEERLRGLVDDNCGVTEITASQTTFSSVDIGSNNVEVVARDVSGNEKRLVIVVTIADDMPPVVRVKGAMVSLDASGRGTLSIEDVDNGSTDNGGVVHRELSRTEFTIADLGEQAVKLHLTDASGNSTFGTATVNVVDPIAPVVSVADVSLVADSNGSAALTLSEVKVAIDEVGELDSVYLSQSEFVLPKDSVCRVTLTAVDRSGNVGSGSFLVLLTPAVEEEISIIDTNDKQEVALQEVMTDATTLNTLMENPLYDFYTYGPNPVEDKLTVYFKQKISEPLKIDLRTVEGGSIHLTETSQLLDDHRLLLTTKQLPAGLYLLTIEGRNQKQTVKVVKR